MIKEMHKLRIVGPKSVMPEVIGKLHQLQMLHITEKEIESTVLGEPLASAESISAALVQARSLLSRLNLIETTQEKNENSLPKIIKEVNSLADQVKGYDTIIKSADEVKKQEQIEKLGILRQLGLDGIGTFSTLSLFVGSVEDAQNLENEIKKITQRFSLTSNSDKNKTYIALCVETKHAPKAKEILAGFEFAPLDFEDVRGLKIESLKKQLSDGIAAKKKAQKALADLSKSFKGKLPSYEFILSQELEKAEAPLSFRETQKAFVATGFVPKEALAAVENELKKISKNKVIIEVQGIDEHHDKVPIALKNPKPVRDFQFFLNLYSLPKYKEFDPTWMLFITFPIFFGFMLGDMGYGIVSFLLFIILRAKMPEFKQFFNIMMISSISSIVFGAVFSEFFGLELYHPILNRNPEHGIWPLMITAIAIGVVHINIGLIIGFKNELKEHGFMHAFFHKCGWMLLQMSVAILVLSYLNILALLPLVGYILIALSIFIIYKGEGLNGIVELPSIFGNILSYSRLMAIGLSSVGIALVVNDMSAPYFEKGGLGIILGVIILLIGHTMNVAIGCLGGFLHSLRLHYVELFGKFYKGGGIAFKPFGGK
jgi:V/A-type H+-transporting ATPase subunit I